MDLWEGDAIDLGGPPFIEFSADRTGAFRFIAVDGQIDWRHDVRSDRSRAAFSWEGYDEGDQVSGRGWVEVESDGSIRGHLFFHAGDDSGFRAVRERSPSGRTS